MIDRLMVDVPLAVVSCDFRVASTQFREMLVSTPESRLALFEAMRRIDPTVGCLTLETCNRIEWVVSAKCPDWISELLKARMLDQWKVKLPGLAVYPNPVAYLSTEAVYHLYRLVIGLESLVTGEAQIAGQFHSAMTRARQEHTLSPVLNRLESGAGRLAKAGFRMGFRSNSRRGIHGLVCGFLEEQFRGAGSQRTVAVAGMGSIGRKTAQLLEESGLFRVIRVNRTVRPEHQGRWHALEDLPALSRTIDGLVIATGGLQPVVTQIQLDLAGRDTVLPIIDIGVPRQVDTVIQRDPKVHYHNLDNLMDVPRDEIEPDTMRRVEGEVEREADRFLRFCMERDMSLLLDRIHQGRREFATTRIPAFVSANFGDLDQETRAKVESAMKKSITEYAGEIHQALQKALEGCWSQR